MCASTSTPDVELLPLDARLARPEVAERVVVPSFDALTHEDRTRLRDAEPLTYLHAMHGPGPGALARSEAGLRSLLEAGVFGERLERAVFGYRISAGDHSQTGLVCGVRAADIGRGRPLRTHEDVRPGMARHLTHYLRELRVTSSPVTAVVAADAVPSGTFERLTAGAPDLAVGDGSAPDGVRQEFWAVTGADAVDDVLAAFAPVEAAYVTDGHHRSAAALAVGPDTRVLLALFPDDAVHVVPFDRVVRPASAQGRLRAWLDRVGSPLPRPDRPARGEVVVWCDGRWWSATLPHDPDLRPPASLDPALLQAHVLGPLLDVADPAGDPRLSFVPATVPLEQLATRAGPDGVAFALAGVALDDIRTVADTGATMPPKSTYFAPKPRSGCLLVHV